MSRDFFIEDVIPRSEVGEQNHLSDWSRQADSNRHYLLTRQGFYR